jgi:uncharacterized protein YqgV (UPF0045/DUF77 family)
MLAEFSINLLPTEWMGRDVAKVIETLERAGLHYQLGPMRIAVEGTCEQIKEVILRCPQLVALKHDNPNFPDFGARAPSRVSE